MSRRNINLSVACVVPPRPQVFDLSPSPGRRETPRDHDERETEFVVLPHPQQTLRGKKVRA